MASHLHFRPSESELAALHSQTFERPYEGDALHSARNGLTASATILLVEDESFVREVTCEVLRSAGYRVLTANDGAEAVRIFDARRGRVELLLTDVVLPGVTGRVLAEKFRSGNPALKVLLVSGYGEQIAKLEADGEEYLGKPYCSERLLRKVRQVLDSPAQVEQRIRA